MELSCRAQLTSGQIGKKNLNLWDDREKIIVKCEPVHDAFENGQHNDDVYAYIIILNGTLTLCHWLTRNQR